MELRLRSYKARTRTQSGGSQSTRRAKKIKSAKKNQSQNHFAGKFTAPIRNDFSE